MEAAQAVNCQNIKVLHGGNMYSHFRLKTLMQVSTWMIYPGALKSMSFTVHASL